jgi:hypothetical protein
VVASLLRGCIQGYAEAALKNIFLAMLGKRDITAELKVPSETFLTETFNTRDIAIECLRQDPVVRRMVIDGRNDWREIDCIVISKTYEATVSLKAMRELLEQECPCEPAK